MNRSEIARGFGWNLLFNTVNRALFPIIGILFARALGPAQMGAYSVLAMMFALGDILRDAGIGASYVADPDAEERESDYVLLSLLVGLVAGGAFLIALPVWLSLLDSFQGLAPGLIVVGGCLAINAVGTVPMAKLQKAARFREAGTWEFAASAFSYAVAIPLVLSGYGFMALVVQLGVKVLAQTSLLAAVAKPRLGGGSFSQSVRLGRTTLPVLTNNILYSTYTMADNIVVGKLLGPAAAGLYAVAYNLAVKPLEFLTFPLGRTLFVAFSRSAQDRAELARRFVKSLSGITLFALPLYALLALYAQAIVAGLYGEDFRPAAGILSILCAYLFARSLGSLGGSVLVALRSARLANIGWVFGFAVAVIGVILYDGSATLTNLTGWITVGAATSYAFSVVAALRMLKPARVEFIRWGKYAVLSLVGIGAAFACRYIPAGELAQAVLALLLGGLVHLVVIGTVLARNPFACLSLSGWRQIANN